MNRKNLKEANALLQRLEALEAQGGVLREDREHDFVNIRILRNDEDHMGEGFDILKNDVLAWISTLEAAVRARLEMLGVKT